jgi:hypothetical protein
MSMSTGLAVDAVGVAVGAPDEAVRALVDSSATRLQPGS